MPLSQQSRPGEQHNGGESQSSLRRTAPRRLESRSKQYLSEKAVFRSELPQDNKLFRNHTAHLFAFMTSLKTMGKIWLKMVHASKRYNCACQYYRMDEQKGPSDVQSTRCIYNSFTLLVLDHFISQDSISVLKYGWTYLIVLLTLCK